MSGTSDQRDGHPSPDVSPGERTASAAGGARTSPNAPSQSARWPKWAWAAASLAVAALLIVLLQPQDRRERPHGLGNGGQQQGGSQGSGDPPHAPQYAYGLEVQAAAGNPSWQHWAPVLALAITPDERTIISLGADGQLTLWDLASEEARQSLAIELPKPLAAETAAEAAPAMALSADGGVLAVSTAAGTAWWRLPQLEEMVPAQQRAAASGQLLGVSPDGRQLLVWRGGLRAIDTATGDELFTIPWLAPNGAAPAAADDDLAPASPPNADPVEIATAPQPSGDAAQGAAAAQPNDTKALAEFGPRRAVYRQDGRYLALAGNSRVVVWDLATAQTVAQMDAGSTIQDVAFGDGDTLLIAGAADVGVWDLLQQQALAQIQPHRFSGDPHRGRIVLADHAPLIAVIEPEGVTITAVSDRRQVAQLATPAELVGAPAPFGSKRHPQLEFSAGGRYVAFDTSRFGIQVWEPSMQRQWPADGAQRFAAVAVSYSPDGQRLALFDRAGRIRLVEAATGQTIKDFNASSAGPVALSGDWQTYAVVEDGTAIIRNLENGERLRTIELDGGKVDAVALSKESQLLACSLVVDSGGFEQRMVRVWDVATGERQCEINVNQFPAHRLVFHPDGRRLALLRKDEVLLLDTATGEPVWEEPQQPFFRSRPGGTGKRVAVQTADPWLRVVDTDSAEDVLHATGDHANDVVAAAFSADETLLAGCTDSGRLLLWELPSASQPDAAGAAKIEPTVSMRLGPERGRIFDVAFAPDGGSLAVACGDGVTRVLRIVREKRSDGKHPGTPDG